MNAKLTHPFFIGLAIMFLSLFFTFYKVSPKVQDYEDRRGVTVSASMFDAAFGNKPTIKSEGRRDRFDVIEMSAATHLLGIPKVLGINFLIIILLLVWAVMNFLFNDNMTVSNRRMLITGMGISFLLFFLVLIWDINYYRGVLNDTGGFEGRVRDYVNFVPVFGFFAFVGGWLVSMYGAFFQRHVYS
ncbi:MAG TPA: hypothetical protein VHM26_09540 [Chitinophagaceae bacterium]|jgi:hypothetical protein|nr:hypothetical protein [Chitinophagaceae bacterium]